MVWTKGGAPIDTSHVHVRTSDFDTVFFVRQAARSDSGEYELTVQIENMKDTATVCIRVVGARPAGGEGRGGEENEPGRGKVEKLDRRRVGQKGRKCLRDAGGGEPETRQGWGGRAAQRSEAPDI